VCSSRRANNPKKKAQQKRSFRPGFTLSQGSLAPLGFVFLQAPKMSASTITITGNSTSTDTITIPSHPIAYQCENRNFTTTVHPTLSLCIKFQELRPHNRRRCVSPYPQHSIRRFLPSTRPLRKVSTKPPLSRNLSDAHYCLAESLLRAGNNVLRGTDTRGEGYFLGSFGRGSLQGGMLCYATASSSYVTARARGSMLLSPASLHAARVSMYQSWVPDVDEYCL
jgi:hypothetical protein